jgi:myo-inositol-1(or 4)-monophosphatase
MQDFLTVCEKAARAGGAILQDWVNRITIREKGPKDLVTEADFASQLAIRQIVLSAFPDHQFLGEECESTDNRATNEADEEAFRWIVDPLDGTLNYIRGMPSYCVSVALERSGELLAGVVFDPMLGECFKAAPGRGAFLNEKPIRASRCKSLRDAMVAISLSANVPRGSVEVSRFVEAMHAAQTVRRMGSAALNLCYVGTGRLDAYFASSVHSWDVAAGVLIAREAGAVVTSISGTAFDLRRPNLAAAVTAELHTELLKALSRAE